MPKIQLLLFIAIIALIASCNQKDDILASINDKNIYQSQIDALIKNDIDELRMKALESYISKTLIEIEASKRGLSEMQLSLIEISAKAKEVSNEDVVKYSHLNNIEMIDSTDFLILKNQIINIYRRSRFEVFIDSLKTTNNVKIFYNYREAQSEAINNIHSHAIGSKDSKVDFYFIGDYDCPSCKTNYQRVFSICREYLDKIQFHFIYYSVDISDKAIIAESFAHQGKFWDINSRLFEMGLIDQSTLEDFIHYYSLDSTKFITDIHERFNETKLEANQKIMEELNIFSVPTIIVDNEIIPGYTSSEDLIQIINFKILNR